MDTPDEKGKLPPKATESTAAPLPFKMVSVSPKLLKLTVVP